jgi:hypothetical protein
MDAGAQLVLRIAIEAFAGERLRGVLPDATGRNGAVIIIHWKQH